MKTVRLSVLFALLFIAAGCARMKVTCEQVDVFEFSGVHTYQWIDGPEEILNETDTYIIDDFMTALDTQIRLRGWQPTADTVTADVQVAYYIKLKEHTEYTTQAKREEREFSGGFVYDRDQRGWEYAEREPDINVYTIEIGTLTLLVYDAESSRLVWRGKLQTEINRSLPKEKREARIREVAEKLISRIPQK